MREREGRSAGGEGGALTREMQVSRPADIRGSDLSLLDETLIDQNVKILFPHRKLVCFAHINS